MLKSAFSTTLCCITVLSLAAFPLAAVSLPVAELVLVGGSSLVVVLLH